MFLFDHTNKIGDEVNWPVLVCFLLACGNIEMHSHDYYFIIFYSELGHAALNRKKNTQQKKIAFAFKKITLLLYL